MLSVSWGLCAGARKEFGVPAYKDSPLGQPDLQGFL
jgi:hypothetical protein